MALLQAAQVVLQLALAELQFEVVGDLSAHCVEPERWCPYALPM